MRLLLVVVVSNSQLLNHLSHDVVTWDVDTATFRLLTASLHQAMGSTAHASPLYHDNLMQLADVDPHCSGEFWFSERADSKLFSRRFAIVPVSRCVSWSLVSTLQEFDSIIPVDVIRVKCYVSSFFDSFDVPVWVLINKLYFTPVRVVAGLVGVLRNGKGLGTG